MQRFRSLHAYDPLAVKCLARAMDRDPGRECDVGVAPRDETDRAGVALRLARQVTARHDMDDVLNEVFRGLRALVDFGGGSIQMLDDDGWIQRAASEPVAPPHVMAHRGPLGTSVAGRVILSEQPIYLPDITVAPETSARRVSPGVRSYFGV